MTSWIKDIGECLFDDAYIVLSEEQFKSIGAYEASIPTSPSPGRMYRRGGFVYFVCDDPNKPGWQVHVPRRALFV